MKYRRYKQEEKMEIIKIVEGSELGVKPTLKELNIHSSTFYKWYGRYDTTSMVLMDLLLKREKEVSSGIKYPIN